MRIDVVTLFPHLFEAFGTYGVVGRATQSGRLRLGFWNPRDYAEDRHRSVDDRPYGGGPGMVMQVPPLRAAIRAARAAAGPYARVGYLSPQGRVLDHATVRELAGREALILVCGRYEGIDERIVTSDIDEEWSIGDYVLSGGEIASMVVIDAVARWVPGVLGAEASAPEDSFAGGLLDYPHYTRPPEVDGERVPAVLLSGDHAAIARWRLKQSLGRTWLRRPDLLQRLDLTEEQRRLLEEFKTENRTGDCHSGGSPNARY